MDPSENDRKETAEDFAKKAGFAIIRAFLPPIITFFLFFFIAAVIIIILLYNKDAVGGVSTAPECNQTAGSNTTGNTNISGGATILSNDQAVGELAAAGISVTSTGGCSDRGVATCTSLQDLRQNSVCGITNFQRLCNVGVTVTGGTETGHGAFDCAHSNGCKLDISDTSAVTSCILSRFTPAGTREVNGRYPTIYKDSLGNEFVHESWKNHWDIAFKGNNCDASAGNTDTGSTNTASGSSQTCNTNGSATASGSAALDPTATDCGKPEYRRYMNMNTFNHENWGDPQCTATISLIDQKLQQKDPIRALKWHEVLLRAESGMIPLAFLPPTGLPGLSTCGAWGLFQMGASYCPNNGIYDQANTNWEKQIDNAFNYLPIIRDNPYCYWQGWRSLFPGGDGKGHSWPSSCR